MSIPQPVETTPPTIAPYHPPPSYPPPTYGSTQPIDNRAVIALVLAVLGLVLGLPLGVPGLLCGPIAYFIGKSAVKRIEASAGALGGRNLALTAWILGIVATAAGAVVTLIWLVVFLVAISAPTS
jgi:hypothetical protein